MEIKNRLWTKNFTILTLGSAVSMLGNAASGFAVSLLVLDKTDSTLLYAITSVVFNLPKIIMPSLAGPYLDRFSRAKVIYTLDFISAAIYLLLFLTLSSGWFNYAVMLGICVVVGAIDSVYLVAYDSLYPMLISEGNMSKAYSVSSMLYPLAAIMTPVAAYFYGKVGVGPLFLFTSCTFLTAAIFETRIKVTESQVIADKASYGLRRYAEDFRDGLKYLKKEKGLLTIVSYFVMTTLAFQGVSMLVLPYFKTPGAPGVMMYTYVMAFGVAGRMIGGLVHYKFKYPPEKKFAIAIAVYVLSNLFEGTFLFLPVVGMMAFQLINGFICVTSYNIRISSTQNYLANDMRGRFNGTFQMLTTLGGIVGSLLAGALGDFIPIRSLVVAFALFGVISVYFTMYLGRSEVKKIYNVEV